MTAKYNNSMYGGGLSLGGTPRVHQPADEVGFLPVAWSVFVCVQVRKRASQREFEV